MIKAYTDIEQSKKLAEILPLESADMCYSNDGTAIKIDANSYNVRKFMWKDYVVEVIPCWSLAALLNILPPYLFEFDRGIDLNIYPNLNGKGWHCSYMPNNIENMKTDKFKLITSKDTPIDACVEMIIKLNEQKLI